MKRGNKAVSPVVSTILLISVVIILAVIIFLWTRSFIEEAIQKEILGKKKPIENVCSEVNLKISLSSARELSVVNVGNVPVLSIDVRKEGGGISKIENYALNLGPGDSKTEFIYIEEIYNKITVIPVLLGETGNSKKAYTCPEETGIELELN